MSVYPLHIYIVIRVTGVVKQEAGHEFLHLGSVIYVGIIESVIEFSMQLIM